MVTGRTSAWTNLTILDHEAVVNTWLEHFKHLPVLHVVAYVLKDVAVGYNAKGAKDDPDGDINLDVRDSSLNNVSYLF